MNLRVNKYIRKFIFILICICSHIFFTNNSDGSDHSTNHDNDNGHHYKINSNSNSNSKLLGQINIAINRIQNKIQHLLASASIEASIETTLDNPINFQSFFSYVHNLLILKTLLQNFNSDVQKKASHINSISSNFNIHSPEDTEFNSTQIKIINYQIKRIEDILKVSFDTVYPSLDVKKIIEHFDKIPKPEFLIKLPRGLILKVSIENIFRLNSVLFSDKKNPDGELFLNIKFTRNTIDKLQDRHRELKGKKSHEIVTKAICLRRHSTQLIKSPFISSATNGEPSSFSTVNNFFKALGINSFVFMIQEKFQTLTKLTNFLSPYLWNTTWLDVGPVGEMFLRIDTRRIIKGIKIQELLFFPLPTSQIDFKERGMILTSHSTNDIFQQHIEKYFIEIKLPEDQRNKILNILNLPKKLYVNRRNNFFIRLHNNKTIEISTVMIRFNALYAFLNGEKIPPEDVFLEIPSFFSLQNIKQKNIEFVTFDVHPRSKIPIIPCSVIF